MIIDILVIWWLIGIFVWVDVVRTVQHLVVKHIPQIVIAAFIWPVWYLLAMWHAISKWSFSNRIVMRKKGSN